ncbi:PREDICTED: probable N-acetyltransferase HLS1 [Fragaria vesca subsp. vesca]|uniref:probable N-acetyltransferase HLS1 n=1 Tax=Fragaria vesca subsp. vesca TaxID=101020 RepID=UPI0002C2DD2F|nr:PREDICTED: probable N-acetyltransferase HLS1 [Fragaria vesca subsp. vesca]
MVLKIAAEDSPSSATLDEVCMVVVREYNEESDKVAVEEMERLCEMAGQRGGKQPSLVTDLLGDPKCRIRHFPTHIMLVAVYGEQKEIVGVIRGCVKKVTRGNSVFVKLAYILGLRVSPMHRRLGIGTKLVKHLEEWCKQKGAEYAYMATDCTNEASINLFTLKCSYQKFRTPTILVQPVHAHYKPVPSTIAIVRLPACLAESIYRQIYANSEFFPEDIDAILSSALNLGTFMALPRKYLLKWDPKKSTFPPRSAFAILSVWNTKQVFKLQVKGVSKLTQACCVGSRLVDAWLPWLRLPSFPNVFKQFGVYFMYGLHADQGKHGLRLMKGLCNFVHNVGRDDHGCAAVVAEVSQRDPVREAVPHWTKLSWAEDMWCVKKLTEAKQGLSSPSDWINSRPSSPMIFVDPRDF